MSNEDLAIIGKFFLLFFGVVGLGTLVCLAILYIKERVEETVEYAEWKG